MIISRIPTTSTRLDGRTSPLKVARDYSKSGIARGRKKKKKGDTQDLFFVHRSRAMQYESGGGTFSPSSRRPGTGHQTLLSSRLSNYESEASNDIDEELSMKAIDMVSYANSEHRKMIQNSRHRLLGSPWGPTPSFESLPQVRPHSGVSQQSTVGEREKRARRHLRSSPLRESPCIRAESRLDQELSLSLSINDLSRESCDILGPNSCYDCNRGARQVHQAMKNANKFPLLPISPRNLSTVALLGRIMPDTPEKVVMQKVVDGDIHPLGISREAFEARARRLQHINRKDPKIGERQQRRISAFGLPDKNNFFTNIGDLRTQLMRKAREERKARTIEGTDDPGPLLINEDVEVEMVLDQSNTDKYLGPPILSRDEIQQQHSQPRFYAGQEFKYELPKPPPMAEIIRKASEAMEQMEHSSTVQMGGIDAIADLPEIEAWRQARANWQKDKAEKKAASSSTKKD